VPSDKVDRVDWAGCAAARGAAQTEIAINTMTMRATT
jgi:hypothetical protein